MQNSLFEENREIPDRLGRAVISSRVGSQVIAPGAGFMDDYDFTLNPYSGCSFGCSYCYAAFFVPSRELRESWGDWVTIKQDATDQLRRKRNLQGATIYMSSVTDPYQPIEKVALITRSILEFFIENNLQPRLFIQTRSPLVTRDLDLLQKFDHVLVNMSITTDDDSIRKRFEPGCPSIEQRFKALQACSDAGIRIGVSVSPMLPITNMNDFAQRIREMNPERIVTQPFKASNSPFAASTRSTAKEISSEFGWTTEVYNSAISTMIELLPNTLLGKEGFRPI